MSSNTSYRFKLLCGASSVAMLASATTVMAQDTATMAQENEGALETIIVTARKRAENIQDIPSSVQALSASFLKDSGASGMADYTRFVPSMTVQTLSGSDGSSVYFRGITDSGTNYIASASASIYLNETSVTMVGASPNLRMIDINRIEALAGPQGTLYGAAAQSGTLRVYTNQPNTENFEANLDMTYKGGSKSDVSRDFIGVVNVPLVKDKFAIRIALNEGKDGGYIDNVFGHTPNMMYGDPIGVGSNSLPARSGTLTNSHMVEDNYNKTDFSTVVATALWNINDNWSATGSYRYSENISKGQDFYNPFVGDLEVIQFNPSHREEKWDVGSLVIDGDVGWAQVVSSTSFYNRDTYYNLDSTAYMKYYANWACTTNNDQSYAYWTFPDPDNAGGGIYYAKYCMGAQAEDDWTGTVTGPANQNRFSQEIRFSGETDDFDWMLGLYYEEANDNWDNNWMVPGHGAVLYPDSIAATFWREEGFVNAHSWQNVPPCASCIDEVDQGIGGLYSVDRTNFKQKAIFGEFTYHITEKLDITAGGRYFVRDTEKHYIQYHVTTGTNREPDGIMLKHGYREGEKGGRLHIGKDKKFVPKLTLKYTMDEDTMLYATYTQGFRPGGVNRGRNDYSVDGECVDSSRTATDADGNSVPSCTLFPQRFEPDTVSNFEVGSRMRFNDKFQLNLTAFYMMWDDYQLELLEPSNGKCNIGDALAAPYCGQPWAKVVGNIGKAHTMGLQAEALWVPNEKIDLGGNLSWIEAKIDENFDAAGQARGPVAFGAIKKGQNLPNVPRLKASMWANYNWTSGYGDMTMRAQFSYVGSSYSDLVPTEGDVALPNLKQNAHSVLDLSMGMRPTSDENLEIRFFINNVTDTRAQISHKPDKFGWLVGNSNDYQRMDRVYTNRPREFGLRLIYNFGG